MGTSKNNLLADRCLVPHLLLGLSPRDPSLFYILLTMHRRENQGDPIAAMCRSVLTIVKRHPQVRFIFPVHLNPAVHKMVFSMLKDVPNVLLDDPLSYTIFPFVLKNVDLIMTDSGGIQEEAVTLGVPVVLLRTNTERLHPNPIKFCCITTELIDMCFSWRCLHHLVRFYCV